MHNRRTIECFPLPAPPSRGVIKQRSYKLISNQIQDATRAVVVRGEGGCD